MKGNPCTSSAGKPKRRWATPAAAKFVAEWLMFKGSEPLYTYHCTKCEKWHTSSSPPRVHRKG